MKQKITINFGYRQLNSNDAFVASHFVHHSAIRMGIELQHVKFFTTCR